ncbi:unnamed protein product [Ceutorhynchus assimilis]|uniref:Carboxypeptidase n=1 Tax=Ceutorhynchus assimilis TaxID=467358 RepID=A0A9N9QLW2_9CUCU|nr:unnamed protein product [Ceutorhynchus assimilis]
MKTTTLWFSLAVVLLLWSPLSSSAATINDEIAKNLIRNLNLFPPHDINILDTKPNVEENQNSNNKIIVEKPLRFPNFSGKDEDGVSIDDLAHRAGYYPIQHSHAAKMFYFFFESRKNKKDPVVIWLTGGPGCSSELAVFYENGPFKIANNLSLVWNEFGWDKVSNLLYVDQPTGTGFSYTTDQRDIRHDEDGVSNDLYDFLQAFFGEHPEYASNDFFITGESYAGHYIPAFAARVHKGNKAKEGIHINLKGFAIGNGLTDPAIQYKAYADYALDMGVIKQADYDRINKVMVPACELAIKLCGNLHVMLCHLSFQSIMKLEEEHRQRLAVAAAARSKDAELERELLEREREKERMAREKAAEAARRVSPHGAPHLLGLPVMHPSGAVGMLPPSMGLAPPTARHSPLGAAGYMSGAPQGYSQVPRSSPSLQRHSPMPSYATLNLSAPPRQSPTIIQPSGPMINNIQQPPPAHSSSNHHGHSTKPPTPKPTPPPQRESESNERRTPSSHNQSGGGGSHPPRRPPSVSTASGEANTNGDCA